MMVFKMLFALRDGMCGHGGGGRSGLGVSGVEIGRPQGLRSREWEVMWVGGVASLVE